MSKHYAKSDVQFHADNWARGGKPAVNVKVYTSVTDEIMHRAYAEMVGDDQGDACNLEWAETILGPDDTWLFGNACEMGFDDAEGYARELFGEHVKCWSEGRSGGWLVVDGLKDFESWDAIDVARWHKFETYCQVIANDIPYQMACLLILNEWERATEVADRSKDLASL